MNWSSLRTRKNNRSGVGKSLARFVAAAAASVCMIGIVTTGYAIDFNQSKVVNLGSGFVVPIIDNNGQLPGNISFVAPGPTGNTVYFYNNGAIGLALRGYNGGENAFTTISHINANGGFAAGDARASLTHYLGGQGLELPTDVGNYNFVSTSNLYEGVSAQFEVSGRQLIGAYTVAAGAATEEIRFGFDNIATISSNQRTGDVEIALTSGRTINLHEARVTVAGELTYVPFELDGQQPVLDLATLGVAEQSVSITVKITFGPYYHDYEAVADGDNSIVAVSTAFNTMQNGENNSDGDIILTRLNAEGTEVVSTTIIAGENEDIGYSVAVSDAAGPCGGRLYVAGSTTSADFPADGEYQGEAEAFVLRMDAEAQAINGGVIISAAGRDVAHHVIICGCEVIVVGATDGGLTDINSTEMSFETVLPSVDISDKVQEYYVATLNDEATAVTNLMTFDGPAIGMPLRAGCGGGRVQVGVQSSGIVTASCNANYTSEMSHWFDSPCKPFPAGLPNWGVHAMCWKTTQYASHSFNTSCMWLPHQQVYAGHEDDLNDFEASCFTCGGCGWNDPWGVWQLNHCNDFSSIKAVQIAELALGAAYYHECCGSPVYSNWAEPTTSLLPFAIRRVHMQITDLSGNPISLIDACSTQYQTAHTGDMFDVACLSSTTGLIDFCSMDVLPWHPEADPALTVYPQANWDVQDLLDNLANAGVYIADPPEDQPQLPGNIKEMGNQLSRSITAATSVETVVYENGVAEESTIETRRIRLASFHAPNQPAALPTPVEERKGALSVSTAFGTISSQPNPASGEITVTYRIHEAATVRIEIYNAMGQRVGTVDGGYRQPREYSVSYDTGNLATGTYYLRLSSDSGMLTMPLLIAR